MSYRLPPDLEREARRWAHRAQIPISTFINEAVKRRIHAAWADVYCKALFDTSHGADERFAQVKRQEPKSANVTRKA